MSIDRPSFWIGFGAGVIAHILLGNPAHGAQFDPPARYDHPVPYCSDRPLVRPCVVVYERTQRQLNSLCAVGKAQWGNINLVCSMLVEGQCMVLWPRGVPQEGPSWRHELAHCNGWPANHPK